jgi:hypothetical protein
MKVIAQFYWDCGRMGEVDGLFVTTKEALEAAYGKEVYFGEILGKHSEVYGTFNESDITILTEDQDFITKFIEIMGDDEISGYNPLSYLNEEDEETDDE